MVHSLFGRMSGVFDEGILFRVSNIEFAVATSQRAKDEIARRRDETQLLTWLYVREDQLKLFGFSTEAERSTFLSLIAVPGIGPKQALRILSGLPVERLIEVIEQGDVDALVHLPGLGRKTAQKIVLALADTLVRNPVAAPVEGDDLVQGLVDMGHDRKRALRTLEVLRSENPDASDEELFRDAIVRLA